MSVADMLAHSPPLPFIIDYNDQGRNITTEDEEGIVLRSSSVISPCPPLGTSVPALNLQGLVAINEDYPILEYLIMAPSTEKSTTWAGPATFQAPHLRYLLLSGSTLPI
jgi:hypothetical protein